MYVHSHMHVLLPSSCYALIQLLYSKYKIHSVNAKLLYYNGSKICLESLESSLMWQGWADATKTSTASNKKHYEIFRDCLKGDWICRGLNVQHRLHEIALELYLQTLVQMLTMQLKPTIFFSC